MTLHLRRTGVAAIGLTVAAGLLMAGCSKTSAADTTGTSSVTSSDLSASAHSHPSTPNHSAESRSKESPTSETSTPSDAKDADIAAACKALMSFDAVQSPGGGPGGPPPAEDVKKWGSARLPALEEAITKGGDALGAYLKPLLPVIKAAASDGTTPPESDELLVSAAGYESWAHKNCGYQNVDVTAVDYAYQGIPATLKAGATSLGLTNKTEKGEFHLALLARAKDATITTVDQLLAVPMPEFGSKLDMLGAAPAAPGGAGGILVDLKPGRYFVLCPIPVGGDETSGDMHMMHGMAATFEVS